MASTYRAERQARRASKSTTLRVPTRAGLVARGVLYFLVGILAVQIAFGQTEKEADSSGAVQTVAATPGGGIVLWLLVVGLAGLALWRLAEAAFGQAGPGGHEPRRRRVTPG